MRELLLAGQSELPPDVDDHHLALLLGEGLEELLVLDDLQLHVGSRAAGDHEGGTKEWGGDAEEGLTAKQENSPPGERG